MLVKTVEILRTQKYGIGASIFLPSGFPSIAVHKHASKRVWALIVMLPTSPLVKLPENLFPPGTGTLIMPRAVNLISCDALAPTLPTSPGFFCQTIYNTYTFLLRVRLRSQFPSTEVKILKKAQTNATQTSNIKLNLF